MTFRNQCLVAGLFVVGVLLLAWFAPRQRYVAQQTLPDGSTLSLLALKAGKRHENPLAPLSKKLAARLPSGLRNRFKLTMPESVSSRVSSNYMTVWLTSPIKPMYSASPFKLLISDDHGNYCINDQNSYSTDVNVQIQSNLWLYGMAVLAWPRRAEMLKIQVYSRDHEKLLAEFRVKNPGRDTATPPLVAPAWPVTVRDGDLDFVVSGVWVGVRHPYPDWKPRLDKNPLQRGTRANFQVMKNGDLQTNWYAYQVREIRDAMGNQGHGDGFNYTNIDGLIMNHFSRPPLPVDEPWRMTVEFSRMSGFATQELYALKAVPLPPPGQAWRVATNTFGNSLLELNWETRPDSSSNSFGFWATVMPTRKDYKLTLLRASDNKGRIVAAHNSGGGQSVTHETLTLEPDAESLDLFFAFHPSHVVTFQVKPEFFVKP